ncbi:MAG: WYL domain-containing protein, partial [Lachnospiraceae bacterium]|nr:WYL domain-containing protein [Lachnospiraceae bacterium]
SIQVENNKIIYTDTISGLSDFAKYLRKFGKSAHVIEPQALKNKMKQSFERTLARYEEVSTGELL